MSSLFHSSEEEGITKLNICLACVITLSKKFGIDCSKNTKVEINNIVCWCREEKKIGFCNLPLPEKIILYHIGLNLKSYEILREQAKDILNCMFAKDIKKIKRKPRDIWLEKVKDFPIDIEDDYPAWLYGYQNHIELLKEKLRKKMYTDATKLCNRLNIPLSHYVLNIKID